jgi:hypothetical protein
MIKVLGAAIISIGLTTNAWGQYLGFGGGPLGGASTVAPGACAWSAESRCKAAQQLPPRSAKPAVERRTVVGKRRN